MNKVYTAQKKRMAICEHHTDDHIWNIPYTIVGKRRSRVFLKMKKYKQEKKNINPAPGR